MRFFVYAGAPNSGALVLPTTIAPAAFRRETWIESSVGDALGEQRRRLGGGKARDVLELLHPERDALERPRLAARDARLGGAGLGETVVGITPRAHRIQVGVGLVDARQHRLHQVHG